jgi:hypothetical protein
MRNSLRILMVFAIAGCLPLLAQNSPILSAPQCATTTQGYWSFDEISGPAIDNGDGNNGARAICNACSGNYGQRRRELQ